MANEKITELTALTSGSVAGTDVLPIVDISDTSVSVTGQSKKITQEALFDSGTSMPSLVEVGTITTGTWTGTTLGVGYGGTGLASFTSGDILYASGTTTLAKLAKGSDGDTLTLSSGVPAWSATTGDITGVTAGTNLNGGGTSGAVTLNVDNPVVSDLTGDVTGNVSGSSGSCTGNAATVTNGVYTTNNLSVLAATTSAQLAGVISNETGSGSLVFATSPTLVTPALGTPASGTLTNCTFPTLNQDTTGTAATVTGAAQTAITSVGTLTDLTVSGTSTTIGTVTSGIWNGTAVDGAYVDIEGTEIKSTEETGGTKFLREDGDGTCSWQAASGGGGISWDGSTANGVATYKDADEATVEANLTFDGTASALTIGTGTTGLTIANSSESSSIARLTSDASDNGALNIASGGAAANTRGAYIALYGNEHGGTGACIVNCGDVYGGHFIVNVDGVNVVTVNNAGTAVANTMVMDSGNVGCGGTPSSKLHVFGQFQQKVATSSEASTVTIDFSAESLHYLTVTDATTTTTLAVSNLAAGRAVKLYIKNNDGLNDFIPSTIPSWVEVGSGGTNTFSEAGVPAGLKGVLTLVSWGTAVGDVTAEFTYSAA